MTDTSNEDYKNGPEPDLQRARRAANAAHGVVIKLQEMGLPQDMNKELASLSTDLGDLWGAYLEFNDLLESFINAPQEWGVVGDHLVDMRSNMDHLTWHLNSVRRPINRITQYAYRQASKTSAPEGLEP